MWWLYVVIAVTFGAMGFFAGVLYGAHRLPQVIANLDEASIERLAEAVLRHRERM